MIREFEKKSRDFIQANAVTIGVAETVEKSLKYWGHASILPIVDMMTVNVDCKWSKKLNSCLVVTERGRGKSALLVDLIAKSNPVTVQVLDSKIFESDLVQKPASFYNNRVMIHSDLIVALTGLNMKQREQLINFWTMIVEGNYSRERHKLQNVRTCGVFAMASESFGKYRDEMFSNTFLDRFPIMQIDFKEDEVKQILELRRLAEKTKKDGLLKLPFLKPTAKRKRISIDLSEEDNEEVIDLAMSLGVYGTNTMTEFRAQDYIRLFMLGNAYLNGRKVAGHHDLEMYETIHKYHANCWSGMSSVRAVESIVRKYPNLSDKEILKRPDVSIPRRTFYRRKKDLKDRCAIL